MKVAYISSVAFSDVDFSLLNRLQERDSIDFFLQLYPSGLKGAAVNIKTVYNRSGVFSHKIYPELDRLSSTLSGVNLFVFNSAKDRVLSFERLKASLVFFVKILRGKYDIIHCTWFPDYSLFWLYFFRKKLVFTIHDPLPHSSLKSKSQLFFRKIAMRLGKHFVLLNEIQKDEFIDYYKIKYNTQNVYFSRLGPYDYLTLYEQKLKPKAEDRYILFFGKIFSYKGLKYLLPAMELVHKSYPNCNLVVAGSGKFDFDVDKYKELSYITFFNRFIPEEELVQLIRGASFIVAPYIDATQSGVVMTAYAFDKPCVVTNVGALPSVVKNLENGLVIQPADIESLAKAINFLLSREDLLKSFSRNIHDEYNSGAMSWTTIASDMHCIYEKVTSLK